MLTALGTTSLAFLTGTSKASNFKNEYAKAASAFDHEDLHSLSVYNIKDFGAIGDGETLSTIAIQKAIDACSSNGGGIVWVPNGVFLSATIILKSNVALYLGATAVLMGVADIQVYKHTAFIYAEEQDNIAIFGRGTVYGQGENAAFHGEDNFNGIKGRPHAIHLWKCSNIQLKEFTLKNSASWSIELQESINITVDDIKVEGRCVANNDGLDIVDCHYIRVSNSYFDCGDDGICPKSMSKMGVKNLVITNCIVKSESNAIKFGTAGVGGFQDITISNCTIYDTRLSGIALELVDGGIMDRITITNITMHKVNGGIFIKLGRRKTKIPGILRNIIISNVIADGIGSWKPDKTASYYKDAYDPRIGMTITGLPGYEVENINIFHVYMQFEGGGTKKDAKSIMVDKPAVYPEYNNYGITPAYAFNCRYVKNLRFSDVQFDLIKEDHRPALFFDHSSIIRLTAVDMKINNKASSFIRLNEVTDIFVTGCKPQNADIPFILLDEKSRDITEVSNDFSRVKKGIEHQS